MITDEKLHHILGVARKCYAIAKSNGEPEDFCRKMFMIGWMHDVGYEFLPDGNATGHPKVSEEMYLSCLDPTTQAVNEFSNTSNAIQFHGHLPDIVSKEWMILNMADMTIDHTGKEVDVHERLDSIKKRRGQETYELAYKVAQKVGLIE